MDSEYEELQDILSRPPEEAEGASRSLQQSQAEASSVSEDVRGLEQWEVSEGNRYFPTGKTTSVLPAGTYAACVSSDRGIYFEKVNVKTDDLVDLDDSKSMSVVNNIRYFWTRSEIYNRNNLVYKRGILLWGPPGGGKTATLGMMTKDLILNDGIIFICENPEILSKALRLFRVVEPQRRVIIVLEDIDELIEIKGEHSILSLLDGEYQIDNVVSIATTNYPEKLGHRIINRPSRFDEVVKIGMPSSSMRMKYMKHILKDEADKYPIEEWVEDTDGLSIAHVKELVIAVAFLGRGYQSTISRLKSMRITPKSSRLGLPPGFLSDTRSDEEKLLRKIFNEPD